jgi:uncharacterized protein YjbJ (UPF0337 family)
LRLLGTSNGSRVLRKNREFIERAQPLLEWRLGRQHKKGFVMGAEDRMAGKAKQIKGKANDIAGAARGDTGQQMKGKAQKMVGKAQDALGKAESSAKKTRP